MDAILQPLRKYADFQGRAGREEYWTFFLLQAVVIMTAMAAGWVFRALHLDLLAVLLGLALDIVYLALLAPAVAVSFRRLHDSGRSAWWLLIALAPVLGWLALLVLMLLEGTVGDNRYGPDPKHRGISDTAVFA